MVEARGRKIIMTHNRFYNNGSIVGRRRASMVTTKPALKSHYHVISYDNKFLNNGKILSR
ncbi:hypothetical protein [Desulfobacter latus]|uniref:Uncharacterized protein n=1 Tax=Desulfobacter latus TaxID=2292 RepID=A0A850SUE7_9BACT|nr:hypothetical protein [Desulfobacter latus]NWH04994.1 hypothetical protein [Desulfobacter latus]